MKTRRRNGFKKITAKKLMKGGVKKTFETVNNVLGGNYEGDLNDIGEKHGKGDMVYDNGDKYQGDWENDKKHGKGTMVYATSSPSLSGAGSDELIPSRPRKYEGDWENDKKHGEGTMVYDNGNKYQGNWENDEQNGKGILTWANNQATYDGDFKHDKFDGDGHYIHKTDHYTIEYIGQFADDKKNGRGTLTTTGLMGTRIVVGKVIGTFLNDKIKEGEGKRCLGNIIEDGVFKNSQLKKGTRTHSLFTEEGEFENGIIKKGTMFWPNGPKGDDPNSAVYMIGTYDENGNIDGKGRLVGSFKYDGDYINGKMSGQGVLTYPDGRIYEGHLKDDKPDGYGTLTFDNGKRLTGIFHQGYPHTVEESNIIIQSDAAARRLLLTELGSTAQRTYSTRRNKARNKGGRAGSKIRKRVLPRTAKRRPWK